MCVTKTNAIIGMCKALAHKIKPQKRAHKTHEPNMISIFTHEFTPRQ